MKQDCLFAFSVFILLFIVSFICSIVLGMGKAESLHEPASLWMYARRGLMIIFGIVIPWLRGKDNSHGIRLEGRIKMDFYNNRGRRAYRSRQQGRL